MENEKNKPQSEKVERHMEKSIMTEPAEEFIEDKSVPSKSMQSGKEEPLSSPQRSHDIKPAGHQTDRDEVFEPGVEG